MRAVIDTNVWVSALLNSRGAPARVRSAFVAGLFTLILSEPLLAELEDVLNRPRIRDKYGLRPDEIAEFLDLLRTHAEVVEVVGAVRLCRDPDDDIVVETAMRGQANVLVTRDDDLKGVEELRIALATIGIAVVTVQQFLDMLQK